MVDYRLSLLIDDWSAPHGVLAGISIFLWSWCTFSIIFHFGCVHGVTLLFSLALLWCQFWAAIIILVCQYRPVDSTVGRRWCMLVIIIAIVITASQFHETGLCKLVNQVFSLFALFFLILVYLWNCHNCIDFLFLLILSSQNQDLATSWCRQTSCSAGCIFTIELGMPLLIPPLCLRTIWSLHEIWFLRHRWKPGIPIIFIWNIQPLQWGPPDFEFFILFLDLFDILLHMLSLIVLEEPILIFSILISIISTCLHKCRCQIQQILASWWYLFVILENLTFDEVLCVYLILWLSDGVSLDLLMEVLEIFKSHLLLLYHVGHRCFLYPLWAGSWGIHWVID